MEIGDALWDDWAALLWRARPELTLFGPEWYATWKETSGRSGRWTGELRILVARDDLGVLRGVMPLGIQRLGIARVHSMAGDWQPRRTIIADAVFEREVGFAFGRYLASCNIAALRLGPMTRSAPATSGLMDALRQTSRFVETSRTARLAVCNASTTWNAYKKNSLNGKFLRSMRRYEKKVRQTGAITIDHIREPHPDETSRLVDDLGRIERRSWLAADEKGSMRFADDPGRTFWRKLIDRSLSPNDQLDCWIMRLDGQPVSFCFTLTCGETRYVVANQYDVAVKKFGTGKTLYHRMIKEGIARGVRRFDFGDGDLHYKKDWGASYQEELDTYLVIPNRVLGGFAQCAWTIREWLRSSQPDHEAAANVGGRGQDKQPTLPKKTPAVVEDPPDEHQSESVAMASETLFCAPSSSHESSKGVMP